MWQIKTDPLPVISQKWGREDEDKKLTILVPFPIDAGNGSRTKDQTELFQRYKPINACNREGKMTPCNTRVYFNQPNLTGFGRMMFLISFLEKVGIEEDLDDVFNHTGYIYSISDIFLSNITGITVGVDRLYHLNAIRNEVSLTKALGLDQLPEESTLRRQLTISSDREVEKMRRIILDNLARANKTDRIVEIVLNIDST